MFTRKRTNPLNSYFFKKFQEQVSKASGFKPVLSYDDFLKMVKSMDPKKSEVELPPLSVNPVTQDVPDIRKTWAEENK